jgi:hypothetical protein
LLFDLSGLFTFVLKCHVCGEEVPILDEGIKMHPGTIIDRRLHVFIREDISSKFHRQILAPLNIASRQLHCIPSESFEVIVNCKTQKSEALYLHGEMLIQ